MSHWQYPLCDDPILIGVDTLQSGVKSGFFDPYPSPIPPFGRDDGPGT